MSEVGYREYWDRKVPMEGLPSTRRFEDPLTRLNRPWLRLQRALFVTLPNQLDRARFYRNRFIRAVR